jgi:uncharacterized protein
MPAFQPRPNVLPRRSNRVELWKIARVAAVFLMLSALVQTSEANESMDNPSEIRSVLERYVSAWQRNDLGAVVAAYHPDFTIHYFGHNSLTGIHTGKPAALQALGEFSKRTQRRLIAVVDIMAGRDLGSVIVRESFNGGNGAIEVERLLVFRIEKGLLRECWVYDQNPAAIDQIVDEARR